jgi:hypothetical protein
MARDLDEFVVGAQLRVDDVIQFLREVQPLLAGTRPSLASVEVGEHAVADTKRDLVGRLRNGRLGRLLFRREKL